MMTKQRKQKCADVIFPAILLVYSLLLINQGLTVTDTGYNYSNFIHFSTLDPMWKFSTFLSNALGAFFSILPYGHTVLGLNFYTGLVKAGLAIMVYFFCVKGFHMNPFMIFLAELMALGYCWCPTSLLYNYCTYFFFNLGAVLLCLAVKQERNMLYFLAGISLGVNVLVRLPNLAEMGLIAALWVLFLLKKERIPVAIRSTLFCVGGYVTGAVSVLLIISIVYGPKQYIAGITQLLAMPSEAAGYSLKEMIRGDITQYIENLKWFVMALPFLAVGGVVYLIKRERAIGVKRIFCAFLGCMMLFVFYKKNMFRFVYYNYEGIYVLGMVFLMVAGLFGLYVMFFGGKDYDLRMLGMVVGLIILITPLGSNNYLFSAVNNLFLVIPFVFECMRRWWKKERHSIFEPIRILCGIFVAFAFLQGILFGATFVFRDGIYGEERNKQVEDNAVLAGMWTNSQNASMLNGLNRYLTESKLKGSNVILYDNVPGLGYYMDLIPVLSTTWPDLDSYSVGKFQEELQCVSRNMDASTRPIVITGALVDDSNNKRQMLNSFLEEHEYQLVYAEEGVFVYR